MHDPVGEANERLIRRLLHKACREARCPLVEGTRRYEPYEPTPEEIEAACAQLQTRWTPKERRRRANFFVPV